MLKLAFPYGDDLPAFGDEGGFCLAVALSIALEFGEPISGVAFGNGGSLAALVAMPEAAVYEEGYFAGGKYDIGSPGECFVFRAVDRIAIAESVEEASHQTFGFRVLTGDTGHEPRAFGLGEFVHHTQVV